MYSKKCLKIDKESSVLLRSKSLALRSSFSILLSNFQCLKSSLEFGRVCEAVKSRGSFVQQQTKPRIEDNITLNCVSRQQETHSDFSTITFCRWRRKQVIFPLLQKLKACLVAASMREARFSAARGSFVRKRTLNDACATTKLGSLLRSADQVWSCLCWAQLKLRTSTLRRSH